ncbi:MAG: response regulator [Anaerolineae bacterium]
MSNTQRENLYMSLRGKHIFIVDDNVFNRATYQIILFAKGAYVEFDRWGRDTVKLLQGKPHIDLIILDLMLPMGVTGYGLFTAIREIPGFETKPILAVSASDPYSAMEKCREMGFSGYIAKPINEEAFPDQIARVMRGESVWDVNRLGN